MKLFLYFILCVCFVMLTGCDDPETLEEEGPGASYGKSREILARQELSHPEKFVRIIFEKKKRNLVGKSVVRFRVLNTATSVSYQNIRIRSVFYQGQQQVANHEDVFREILRPGDDEEEMIRYRTPRGTDSVVLRFMSAAAVPYRH